MDKVPPYLSKDYKDYVHLVSMINRPGALALISSIEWFWFSPRKGNLNDFFHLTVSDWKGLSWMVASFPETKLKEAKKLAKQLGMRIGDGVPIMIDSTGVSHFPGGILNGKDNRNMFTIENDSGSPIYKNCTKTNNDILSAQDEVVDGFINGVEWTPQKIVEYIYGVPNFIKGDPL